MLGIYDAEHWKLVRVRQHLMLCGSSHHSPDLQHFALNTIDAADLSWSPCGKYLAIWESSVEVIKKIIIAIFH